MKEKYFYSIPKLRCKVSYNKEENCTNLILQVYKGWFIGWVNVGRMGVDIHIGLRGIDYTSKGNIRSNPGIMHYQGGGTAEFWDHGTFDLQKRVDEMFIDRLNAIAEIEKKKKLYNQLTA